MRNSISRAIRLRPLVPAVPAALAVLALTGFSGWLIRADAQSTAPSTAATSAESPSVSTAANSGPPPQAPAPMHGHEHAMPKNVPPRATAKPAPQAEPGLGWAVCVARCAAT